MILNETDREIVRIRDTEDVSFREISERLEITQNGIIDRYHRTKRYIKLEESETDEIAKLDILPKVYNALCRNNIRSLEILRKLVSSGDICKFRDIGKGAMDDIKFALDRLDNTETNNPIYTIKIQWIIDDNQDKKRLIRFNIVDHNDIYMGILSLIPNEKPTLFFYDFCPYDKRRIISNILDITKED